MSRLRELCGTAREGRVGWLLRRRWRAGMRPPVTTSRYPSGAGAAAAAAADVLAALEEPGAIMGPLPRWRRVQNPFGTCGGQAGSAVIEVVFPEAPRASAMDLWRGARRRLGLSLSDLSQGTKWSAIFAELEERGWDDWRPGEDQDPVEGGKGAPPAGDNLRDELRADDRRGLVQAYRVSDLDDLDDALAQGLGVAVSLGTKDPYLDLGPDQVATDKHLGGNDNGHAQRIIGRVKRGGRRRYIGLNWWDDDWAGCHVGDLWLPGCGLIDEDAMRKAWHIWAIARKARARA